MKRINNTDYAKRTGAYSDTDLASARDYLESIYNMSMRIRYLKSEISALQLQAQSITVKYTESSGSGSRNVHAFEDVLCKLADFEMDLEKELTNLIRRKQIALDYINKVSETNGDYGMLLYMRYFECKSWDTICYELTFSYPHIFRIHKKALKMFAEMKRRY